LGQIKALNSSFLSNLMIAKNEKIYIEKILDIVNEKYIKLNELKRMICRKKKNLLSFKNLEYVSNEWRVFLNSIV
jgi:RNase P subunit RPR2